MPLVPEIPPQITPASDAGYLEELTKAIFRSGFSWRVVGDKWPNFRRAFHDFDPVRVADFGLDDLTRLTADSGIVRNRRKLEATIENAQRVLELSQEHGSFMAYLRSLDGLDYYQRVDQLTAIFRGLGPMGAYAFLHCVNEPHPPWEQRHRPSGRSGVARPGRRRSLEGHRRHGL